MRIILIGPPGVGKGTQSELLTEHYQPVPLSSGAIFRSEMEACTDLGEMASRYISQGRLVPSGVTIQMMFKRLRTHEVVKRGFILDGFPRTIDQAIALDEFLMEVEQPLDGVISIEVDPEVVVYRLEGRIGCTKCGAIYHQTNKPPKRDWICDNCNSPLVVRKDDSPDSIRERLREFAESTAPVIAHYEKQNLVRHIDGGQDPTVVFQSIVKSLGL